MTRIPADFQVEVDRILSVLARRDHPRLDFFVVICLRPAAALGNLWPFFIYVKGWRRSPVSPCMRSVTRNRTANSKKKGNIMKVATNIARYLLGTVFFVFGIDGFLHLIPLPPLPAEAHDFIGAMIKTGYLFYLVKATEVAAGALLLSGRFVPFALVLLSPVLLNIVLFHAFLNAPQEVAAPLVFVGIHLFLVWQYRDYYKTLFTMNAAVASKTERLPATYAQTAAI